MVMRSQATDWGVRPNAGENGQITPESAKIRTGSAVHMGKSRINYL